MKKVLLFLLVTTCISAACKKEKDKPATTTPPATMDGFVWKEDGGAEISADSAFWTSWSNGTGVRAYKNGMANFFEINWDGAGNTGAGAKDLAAGKGLSFLKDRDTYTNTGKETLTITGSASDKLSGSFEVAVSGGSIKKLNGTFTNIPKR